MYCSHFGLQRPPFNNTPDPSFYYSTPDHEEALATLQYATLSRKGFVLVTGEVGAGKTLTGRMFLRQIDGQASTAVITHTHLNARQLLAAICAEFELSVPDDATNLQLADRLQEFLLDEFAKDRFVVVLLDEAQNLPDESFEALRMLGNLEADDAKLLQVCILGQPELRDRFKRESMRQLDQRLFRRFHLSGLTAQQTNEYILRRLAVAGCSRPDVFTADALDKIYEVSRGIPRVINQLCDNALLAAYAAGRQSVEADVIEQVIDQEGLVESDASPDESAIDAETASRIEKIYGSNPEVAESPDVVWPATGVARLSDAQAAECNARAEAFVTCGGGEEASSDTEFAPQAVVVEAAAQWPAVKQAINDQRTEIQQVIDEVNARCRMAFEQIDTVAKGSASADRLEELRRLHEAHTQSVLNEISASRAEIHALIEQTDKRVTETQKHLRGLRSTAVNRETVAALEQDQSRRIAETVARLDQYKAHIDELIGLLKHQSDQTQASLSGLVDSCSKMQVELSERMDRKLSALAEELQNCREQTARADELAGLREAQARTRMELAGTFESKLSEINERMQAHIATTEQEARALRESQARSKAELDEEMQQRLGEIQERLSHELKDVAHAEDVKVLVDKQSRAHLELAMRLDSQLARMQDAVSEQFEATARASDLDDLRRDVPRVEDLQTLRDQTSQADEAVKGELETKVEQTREDLQGRIASAVQGIESIRASQDRLQEVLRGEVREEMSRASDELTQRVSEARGELQAEVAGTTRQVETLRTDNEADHERIEGRITHEVHRLDGEMQRNEEAVGRLEGDVSRHGETLDEHAASIGRVEDEVARQQAQFVEHKGILDDHGEAIEANRQAVDEQQAALDAQKMAVARHDTTLADHEEAIRRNTADVEAAGKTIEAVSCDVSRHTEEIEALAHDAMTRFDAVNATLSRMKEETIDADDVQTLREEYGTSIAALSSSLDARAGEIEALKQSLASSLEQVAQGQEDAVAEVKAQVGELERTVRRLRHRFLKDHAATQERFAAIEKDFARRSDLDQMRRDHAAEAAEMIQQVQTNRQAVADLMQDITKRFRATHERLQTISHAAETDSQDLSELRRVHAEDVANLLRQLEQQRQSMQEHFDSALNNWTQSQQEIEKLRATAADAAALEELRSRQSRHSERVMRILADQRRNVESLVAGLGQRCDEMLARIDALPANIATTDQIQSLHEEAQSNKSAIESAVRLVAEQCGETAEALKALETRAASVDDIQEMRASHAENLDRIVQRIDGQSSEYQAEFDALNKRWTALREDVRSLAKSSTSVEKFEHTERLISQDMSALKRRVDDVTDRRQKDVRILVEAVQRLTERVKTLETMERPQPVKIELRPRAAEELNDLNQAAEARAEEMRALLANAGEVGSQLRESAGQVEQVMRDWMAGADEVRGQSEQLRASAAAAGPILQALRKCNEVIDAKLKSPAWHGQLRRGEEIAARIEQAVPQYAHVEEVIHNWQNGRAEAEQFLARLESLLGEAAKITGRMGRVGAVMAGFAGRASNLSETIENAREQDEQQRPSRPRRKNGQNVETIHWPRYRATAVQ